jgi:hypothetical protein
LTIDIPSVFAGSVYSVKEDKVNDRVYAEGCQLERETDQEKLTFHDKPGRGGGISRVSYIPSFLSHVASRFSLCLQKQTSRPLATYSAAYNIPTI